RVPPVSTLVPYPTLFRSSVDGEIGCRAARLDARDIDDRAPPASGHHMLCGSLGRDQHRHQIDVDMLSHAALALLKKRARRHAARSEEHTSELQSRENLVC